jgi:hydrogenase expression/formation protein HypD
MADAALDRLVEEIRRVAPEALADGQVRIMEVCGTHTMSIARNALRSLLPDGVELISGPGCPVCVTEVGYIDRAVRLARARDDVVIGTYGDMIRVPGSLGCLGEVRAGGARVEVVYSADQAVDLARREPDREVVFLAVGFETTAPATALAIRRANTESIANFSILTAHKLIPPAMLALSSDSDVRIDGFLCPGHVSVVIGSDAYAPIAQEHGRACVVAGFDPVQILSGIAAILRQRAEGRSKVESVYPVVSREGNIEALSLLRETFRTCDATWRGFGVLPASGLRLQDRFERFDASVRFDLPDEKAQDPPGCRCGDVLRGRLPPEECELFEARCNPRSPIGPCMVSSEGACAAAFKYGHVSGGSPR